MTKSDQLRIIQELCNSVKEKMMENIDKVPENWDGNELRQWIEDIVKLQVNYRPLKGQRKKDYEKVIYSKENMI